MNSLSYNFSGLKVPETMPSWTTRSGLKIVRVLGGRSNVFLVIGEKIRILIDTSPSGYWVALQKQLGILGVDRIDYLVLTHTHFDHAGNAQRVKEKYKAKVIVHKDEAACLAAGENPLTKGSTIFTRVLVNVVGGRYLAVHHYQPCVADILADRKYVIDIPGSDVVLIHTPGHSPGSLSLIADREVVVAGDAIFGVFPRSVFPPFATDTVLLVESWQKMLETGCTVFLPSHGSAANRGLLADAYDKRIRAFTK